MHQYTVHNDKLYMPRDADVSFREETSLLEIDWKRSAERSS
jgi:hypothetical protein